MTKDFAATQQSVVEGAAALREAIPDVIKGYGALGAATYKPGALDPKTKELIALALAIGAHCDGCVAYHAKAARDREPRGGRGGDRRGDPHGWRAVDGLRRRRPARLRLVRRRTLRRALRPRPGRIATSARTHSLDSLSLPGLTRQSILEPAPALRVDARVKPGHDKQRYVPFASVPGQEPASGTVGLRDC
jgi:AhpD family alkylhydroperoxidase